MMGCNSQTRHVKYFILQSRLWASNLFINSTAKVQIQKVYSFKKSSGLLIASNSLILLRTLHSFSIYLPWEPCTLRLILFTAWLGGSSRSLTGTEDELAWLSCTPVRRTSCRAQRVAITGHAPSLPLRSEKESSQDLSNSPCRQILQLYPT